MKVTSKFGIHSKYTELDLSDWHSFTKQVDPLGSKSKDSMEKANGGAGDKENFDAAEFSIKTETDIPSPRRSNRPRPLRKVPTKLLALEDKLLKKLKNKEVRIEDRLDLHGYTQQSARQILLQFLRNAQSHRYKIVLVITGKGDSRVDDFGMSETGVLRKELPRWLIQQDFFRLVAASSIAYSWDGGEGARYIQIRRPR